MTCFSCKKKVDPILTFARPHGRYSRCEECRKKAREKRRLSVVVRKVDPTADPMRPVKSIDIFLTDDWGKV